MRASAMSRRSLARFDPTSDFNLHSSQMRQMIGGVAAFAFTTMLVQAPWAHVHAGSHDSDHYEEQHRGLGPVHGHHVDAAAHGPEWRDKDSPDARALGPVVGIRVDSIAVDVLPCHSRAVVEPTLSAVHWRADLVARAHGPPILTHLPPRAPPA